MEYSEALSCPTQSISKPLQTISPTKHSNSATSSNNSSAGPRKTLESHHQQKVPFFSSMCVN